MPETITALRTSTTAQPQPPAGGRVLVAVDASDRAAAALTAGLDLGRRLALPVDVAHAVETHPPFPFGDVAALERDRAEALSAGMALVHRILDGIGGTRNVGVHVQVGDPATVLERLATTLPAELLVVATRGHGALRAAVMGSTARALTAEPPCPVVVVPPDGDAAGRHADAAVVCAGTEDHGTLAWADRLAAAFDARLLVVGAAAPFVPASPFALAGDARLYEGLHERSRELARDAVDEAARQVEATAVVETEVGFGPETSVLADAVKRARPRCVVLPSGTATSWPRLLAVGACPVVLVP
jgi:nucleotide-binding universal stress UspA family protein